MRRAWIILLAAFCCTAAADELADIVSSCHYANAEWGAEMIDRCVKENTTLRDQVLAYPEQHKRIVSRCRNQSQWGWGHVKKCVDDDVAAEAALAQYAKEKDELLAACAAEFGAMGAAKIKACVDGVIKLPAGPQN